MVSKKKKYCHKLNRPDPNKAFEYFISTGLKNKHSTLEVSECEGFLPQKHNYMQIILSSAQII